MGTAVTGVRAWGASIAVHAAIVGLLAAFLGAGHRHHHHAKPTPASRLVWVEPAPPARGVAAETTGVDTTPPSALPAPVPAVRTVPAPEPRPAPPVLSRRGVARPVQPAKPRVTAPPATEVPPATAGTQPDAPAAGVPAGVTGGAVAGVVGGLGSVPLPLAAVATPPELVDRVVPEYPARARALEIEGQVVLEVVLDERGRPEADIRVLRSVRQLDAAAIAAVRRWRFRPARDAEGRAVRVVMEVPVRFMLR